MVALPVRSAPAQPSKPGTSMSLESKSGGNSQVNLSATRGRGKDTEPSADPIRSLSHPRQPPVPLAAAPEDVGIHATTVVTHHELERIRGIRHVYIDVFRMRVAESINHRLPPDAVDFISDHWKERFRFAPRLDSEFDVLSCGEFCHKLLLNFRERLFQV